MAGELVVAGCGMQLGRHISQRVLSEIEHAEIVFALADPWAMAWLGEIRPDLRSLACFYGEDKDRRRTYAEMEAAILAEVRSGQRVCAVFYGHPGVFACVPHRAIRSARATGHPARMEPGISAEACLYADLGIDPGDHGVQSFEATRFLAWQHSIDPAALLILWQVALAGNLDCVGFDTIPARIAVLVDKLRNWYRDETRVILYEAATVPIADFRADELTLRELPDAHYQEFTTLVIPPASERLRDEYFRERLRRLPQQHDQSAR